MSDVVISKILYDDRHYKYRNHFLQTKVVHLPLLKEYVSQIKSENEEASVIHFIFHDSTDEVEGKYLNAALNELNDERIVVHIINPKSFYKLPRCGKVFMYVELDKKTTKKIEQLGRLIENVQNKDDYLLVLVEDYDSITINIPGKQGA